MNVYSVHVLQFCPITFATINNNENRTEREFNRVEEKKRMNE